MAKTEIELVNEVDYFYSEEDYHFGFPLFQNCPAGGTVTNPTLQWRLTIEYKPAVRFLGTHKTKAGWTLAARSHASSMFSKPVPMLGRLMTEADVYDTYDEALKAYTKKVELLEQEMLGVSINTPREVVCTDCMETTYWRLLEDEYSSTGFSLQVPMAFEQERIQQLPWMDHDVMHGCVKCPGR